MAILNEAGRFKAIVLSHGTEAKESGSVQFGFSVRIVEYLHEGQWVNDDRGLEITGYQNLILKDGNLNEIGLKCVRESMGWRDANFDVLNNDSFVNMVVQIETSIETYNGKDRLSVKYLNPENFDGFKIKPMDAAGVNDLNVRFGPRLRAVFGVTPTLKRGTDLKKPAARPMLLSSIPKASPPPTPVDDAPPEDLSAAPDFGPDPTPIVTRDDAWKVILGRYAKDPSKITKEEKAEATKEWIRQIEIFGENWSEIAKSDAIPF